MTKDRYIDTNKLTPGDILVTDNRKRLVYMYQQRGRSNTTFWGAFEYDAIRMLTGDKKMRTRFYGVRLRDFQVRVVGVFKPEALKKLVKIHDEMMEHNDELRRENFDRLDFKHEEDFSGYTLKLDNGEEIKPGDTVIVKFKDGPNKCLVGNKKKHLYDGNTGRVYVWPFYGGQPNPYRKHAMTVHPMHIIRKVIE